MWIEKNVRKQSANTFHMFRATIQRKFEKLADQHGKLAKISEESESAGKLDLSLWNNRFLRWSLERYFANNFQ